MIRLNGSWCCLRGGVLGFRAAAAGTPALDPP
jgi:hypothetical protein